MTIYYNGAYNKEINRIVQNFNRKRNRAIKKGKRLVPPKITVSELKEQYDTRKELNRELRLLEKFGKRDALTEVENAGGAKSIKWEVQYLKSNLKYAKEYFDREIKRAARMDNSMAVTKKEYLDNLKAKRDFLDLEMSQLSAEDFRTFKKTMNDYLYRNRRNLQDYRNWLNEVELIMRNMGYDNDTIDKFFEGFDTLTPEQFINLYRENALVSRIYELYIPTQDGSFKLSTSEDDAKNLIDTMMQEKDQMIERAKRSTVIDDNGGLKEFAKEVKKIDVTKDFDEYATIAGAEPKVKGKTLTKKQIRQLKSLGWYDAVVKKK